MVHELDVVATLADVTGQKLSREQVMDSVSLLPLLRQESGAAGNAVLVHYSKSGTAALRQGPWKLYVFGKNLQNLKPVHLYNLDSNPAENDGMDLLKNPEYADRVERMLQLLRRSLNEPTASF